MLVTLQRVSKFKILLKFLLRKNAYEKKFFSGYYVVESRLAKIFGAQVFRYVLAALSLSIRRLIYSNNLTPLDMTFKKLGICTIEEFLTKEQARLVNAEFNKKLEAPTNSFDDESTVVKRSTIEDFSSIPSVAEHILNNPQVVELVQNAEGRKYDIGHTWVDIVCSGDIEIGDSQKVLPTDNFYATHKMWYFLDEVTLEHGPLIVTPGTSRFSLLRATFEYINSLSYQSQNVAWRPSQRWQNILKLRPEPVTVAANTLVIADTHGFHRRGDSVAGMERRQIHFRVRINPLKRMFSYAGESE